MEGVWGWWLNCALADFAPFFLNQQIRWRLSFRAKQRTALVSPEGVSSALFFAMIPMAFGVTRQPCFMWTSRAAINISGSGDVSPTSLGIAFLGDY